MTTRAESMNGHLLSQFQDKTVLGAIIEALGEELDELTQVFADLKEKRWIDTGEGKQLDGIGEIVDRPRQLNQSIPIVFFGFEHQAETVGFGQGRMRYKNESWLASSNLNDPEYKILLREKVAKNTSDGTAESTIQSLKYIYNADKIVLQEDGDASISISIGKVLTPSEQILANSLDLLVRPGGVQINRKSYFNNEQYFGFLGQGGALGFGRGQLAHIF